MPADSAIRTIADVDKAGIRVGVTQGSTSQRTLPKVLTGASIVSAPNLKAAAQMMANRKLDAFATNKAILFEMADGMPGARILAGRWGPNTWPSPFRSRPSSADQDICPASQPRIARLRVRPQ